MNDHNQKGHCEITQINHSKEFNAEIYLIVVSAPFVLIGFKNIV